MAKIERYVAGGNRTNTGGARIPAVPMSSSGGGQLAISGALQSVSNDFQAVNEHFRRARQVSLMSGLKVGLERELSDLELDYDSRQDYEKFNDVNDRIDKLRQKYTDSIGNDNEVASVFMPYFDMATIKFKTGVNKLARNKFVSKDRGALSIELENVHELAGRSANDYQKVSSDLRAMGHAAIVGRAASGVINHSDAADFRNDFDSKLWANYFNAKIKTDPITAEREINDDSMFPGMDRDQRLSLQSTATIAASKRRVSSSVGKLLESHGIDFVGISKSLRSADGLTSEERRSVMNEIIPEIRFRISLSEKAERQAEEYQKKQVEENDFNSWIVYRDNKLTRDKLFELARNRQISQSAFNAINEKMASGTATEKDNPYITGALWEDVMLGRDVNEKITEALNDGNIAPKTAIAMQKASASSEMKAAASYVSRAMQPSQFDRWSPDKNIRYAEAQDRLQTLIERGAKPIDAAKDVVDSYVSETRRTIRGLRSPIYLKGDKQNINDLNSALEITQKAARNREITPDQFFEEVDLINQLMDIAEEMKGADTVPEEIRKRAKSGTR